MYIPQQLLYSNFLLQHKAHNITTKLQATIRRSIRYLILLCTIAKLRNGTIISYIGYPVSRSLIKSCVIMEEVDGIIIHSLRQVGWLVYNISIECGSSTQILFFSVSGERNGVNPKLISNINDSGCGRRLRAATTGIRKTCHCIYLLLCIFI